MTSISAVIAIVSLAGTVVAGIAAYVTSEEFFRKLVVAHPELKDSFPLPGVTTRYGPIRPSHMSYLKRKLYLTLPERDLQIQGSRILKYLYLHAVLFVVGLLSLLFWQYESGF